MDSSQQLLYQPCHDLTITVGDNFVKIAVSTAGKTKEFKNYVWETVTNATLKMKHLILGEEAITVEEKKGEEVTITISKKLFVLYPQKAMSFVAYLVTSIKDFSPIEFANGKYQGLKCYVYNTYKRFLDFSKKEEES